MDIFIVIVFSYLIGSFPTAYLLFRRFTQKDIRDYGSGNVGAMNFYELTSNKYFSILVAIFDILKGVLAVFLAKTFYFHSNDTLFYSVVFVVLGHCYSVFLSFKGGRGLATAAGAFIVLCPFLPIFWLLVWGICYRVFNKNIITANIFSLIFSILGILLTPDKLIEASNLSHLSAFELKKLFSFLAFIILISHRNNFKDVIQLFKENRL